MKNLILFSVLVSACGSNNNFLFLTPTDNDTFELLDKLIVPDFNKAIGCQAFSVNSQFVQVNKEEQITRRIVTIYHDTKMVKDYDKKAWGVFFADTDDIAFVEELDYEYFINGIKVVLLHELGHAMGLKHEENTIMNDGYEYMPYDEAMQSLVALINKHKKNQCQK
jgi:hypothetical protein